MRLITQYTVRFPPMCPATSTTFERYPVRRLNPQHSPPLTLHPSRLTRHLHLTLHSSLFTLHVLTHVLLTESFLRQLETIDPGHSRACSWAAQGHASLTAHGRRHGVRGLPSLREGDDIRNIDWGIYLRMDRLILRLFEEEADLPVYIFLDASLSMDHGQPRKLDYAKRVARGLGLRGTAEP